MSHSLGSLGSLGSPGSPSTQSSPSSPISSRSSSGSSQGSARMVKLAKIFKRYIKDGTSVYEEWDGKKPEPNAAIFVPVKLDNYWIKREVSRNYGDLIRKQHRWYDIQGEPLSFKIQDSSSFPTTVGTYLKLSNSSSTWGQPRILDECWHHVTFLLKKFMSEGKIFKFDPISNIKVMSYGHKTVTKPDNYSFWLDLSGIPYRDAHNASTTFFNRDIFAEPTRTIPVSEFENPSLYIPFYEYIPWQYMPPRGRSASPPPPPGSGGKSSRSVKRIFKRKTINRRFKRKTIKRRFKRKTIK
jgi:hypothetical protein